jgi:hypothetical protein
MAEAVMAEAAMAGVVTAAEATEGVGTVQAILHRLMTPQPRPPEAWRTMRLRTMRKRPTTADSDPGAISDPTTEPANVAVVPTDPTVNNAVTPEIAAIEDIATTDPRGGFSLPDIPGTSIPGSGPGGVIPVRAPVGPVDVAINAVIVSAAQSPWDAISKANEVRSVIVTGGIIALGKTPIEGEIPGGGPQPAWLRLVPDLRLLNGSMIPPLVPNVIDIRILDCPITVLNPTEQH